ncbi:diguanylate cyclase [Sporosarcina sp. FSL W7-1349]|uniref:sensor domain-containing diguanylate cyclase n=1 Tax=Sporosarcina sp. FSL W7-1349 TaxID=2921561 RepID=UPI0030F98229
MSIERLFQRFDISTLKGRLRFWFICMIAVLVLLASIPFFLVGKTHKREDARQVISKMIDLQQVVVGDWFVDRLADIRFISELPSIRDGDTNKTEEALRAFHDNHSEFSGIVYVNRAGKTVIGTKGAGEVDVSDRDYYLKAKQGKAYISDMLIGRQSNEPIIIFSAPVYDYSGTFLGLIFGSVPIRTINEIMAQFHDDNQETYLVNRDGTLITESRQGQIGEKLDSAIFRRALEDEPPAKHFYTNQNGDSVLGDYRWVPQNQWLIIGEISKDKIYNPFYRMALLFSMVILLVVFAGYTLMIWVARQIEEPIQDVLVGTREIGKGNYAYRVNRDSYSRSATELQQLCKDFNSMSDLIESHIDSIAVSEERFRLITEYSSDMITIHDLRGDYLYVSAAGKEILHYDDAEMIGMSGYHFIHPDDINMIQRKHATLLETGYVVSTYRIRRKDGEYIWFESAIRSLEGKKDEESQLIIVSRNITERKMVEQQLQDANELLQELSMKDGLVGVGNRRAFDGQLADKWNHAISHGTPLSLIMLDIDYFKPYNDTYGHQLGDDCLRKVATAIDEVLKTTGQKVFRYGGEEFSILLPETDQAGAREIAEQIRRTVEGLQIPHIGSKIADFVTISLGVATTIPTADDMTPDFIEAADRALYKAKLNGRNCVSFSDSIGK